MYEVTLPNLASKAKHAVGVGPLLAPKKRKLAVLSRSGIRARINLHAATLPMPACLFPMQVLCLTDGWACWSAYTSRRDPVADAEVKSK